MAKTILQVATSVLQKLGRLPDGQVAPASQTAIVTDDYEGLYTELLGDSLVNWASDDDIPEEAVYPVKVLLLGRVAADFGVQNVWFTLREEMRKQLARNLASPYEYRETQYEEF